MKAFALAAWALLLTAQVQAGNWFLIDLQGQRPNRSAFLAEFDRVQRRLDDSVDPSRPPPPGQPLPMVHRLQVIAVHESVERADTTQFIVELRCAAGQARLAQVTAWGRNGKAQPQPPMDWAPVGQGWLDAARLIACDEPRWRAALEADRKGGRPVALGAIGLLPFGEHVIGTQLSDAVWSQLWVDGQRPAYANEGTPADLERRKREGQALLAQGAARLEQEAEDQKALMEITERFNARLARMQTKVVQAFQGLAGRTEDGVVKALGAPASMTRSSGQTRMVYEEEGLRSGVVQTPVAVLNGHGAVIGQSTQMQVQTQREVCQRILLLKPIGSKPEPRVYDFQSVCR
ncbi:hypothetical protein HNQ51_002402 [Inhella inkyongensis]|uniref:Uncharacterized protein n=1 Tax=Inhella inkyongensis TaxID=392593 RepID=A0A840S5V8_9BURK|nr:hypothetical protein [Inhella inkyongensis]MBB5205083.1 hypothetical protein [Inhella inkyongensis]